jgi:hypothetical protein
MKPTLAHVSSLELDALALGALPAPRKERVVAHLGACESCRERSEELAALRSQFTRSVLPRHLAALPWRPSPWARWGVLWGRLVPVLVVAGLALFLVLPRERTSVESDLAVKGGAALRIFVHRGERVWKAAEGEALAPRDQVRFQVESGGLPYLLVVSIDGAGKPSVYYPYGGRQSGPVALQEEVVLPDSIVLDAASGPERLYALFSREPLQAEAVKAALLKVGAGGPDAIRARALLPIEADAQASFFFEKAIP